MRSCFSLQLPLLVICGEITFVLSLYVLGDVSSLSFYLHFLCEWCWTSLVFVFCDCWWEEPCNRPLCCLLICLHGLLMFFMSRCSFFLLRRFNVDCSASERLYAGVEGAFAGVTGIFW